MLHFFFHVAPDFIPKLHFIFFSVIWPDPLYHSMHLITQCLIRVDMERRKDQQRRLGPLSLWGNNCCVVRQR